MSQLPNLKNGPIDVTPIEALSSLRAHPEWYFTSGTFERETVVSLLMHEAMLSARVSRARFEKEPSWTAVTADGDWLAGDLRPFSVPTPFPEGGVNAIRAEVLLTAFCDAVVTTASGRRDDIELAPPLEMPPSMTTALAANDGGRVIVFRSPGPENTPAPTTRVSRDIFSQGRILSSLDRLERHASA